MVPVPDVPESAGAPRADTEVLSRWGASRESANRLARKAVDAETKIRIHGVSVSAAEPAPHEEVSTASRVDVEQYFRVHDTPTTSDPLHRTVELPKPVTQGDADLFNRLFGRG